MILTYTNEMMLDLDDWEDGLRDSDIWGLTMRFLVWAPGYFTALFTMWGKKGIGSGVKSLDVD